MSQTKKILIGLLVGLIAGLIFNLAIPEAFDAAKTYVFSPLGKIFVNLIKMLVIPVVLFSLILGAANVGDPKKLGRMGVKTISFFLITTAIALIIAISLAMIIQPGTGEFSLKGAEFKGKEAPPIMDTLISIIPTNPIQSMAEGSMLQIIAISLLIGFALTKVKKTEEILKIIEQANAVAMFLVGWIMKFAPYGAAALIAIAIGGQGLDAIKAMGVYMGVIIFALIIHASITYGSVIYFFGKMNPIEFVKKFSPAMMVAFSTSSSNATLPISMETAQKNLKIPQNISTFVQPLGATINMDGTAIMQGVATVFIANVYGLHLSITAILTVILTATLASIGTAGVPGVGLIMLSMVLTSVGIPVEGIALVLGVDRLLDMCRTTINVTGDAVCTLFVTNTEEKYMPLKNQEELSSQQEELSSQVN